MAIPPSDAPDEDGVGNVGDAPQSGNEPFRRLAVDFDGHHGVAAFGPAGEVCWPKPLVWPQKLRQHA